MFQEWPSGSETVVVLRDSNNNPYLTGVRDAVIRVADKPYIAAEVLRKIGGAADNFPVALKYGPGGRRGYALLTEEVITAIGNEGQHPRNAASVRPSANKRALALHLIDLL